MTLVSSSSQWLIKPSSNLSPPTHSYTEERLCDQKYEMLFLSLCVGITIYNLVSTRVYNYYITYFLFISIRFTSRVSLTYTLISQSQVQQYTNILTE